MGVIGLGLARNLLNAGYRVKGFDPNPATMEAFKSAGGQTCPDAAECAAMVSQFIVCVFDAPQALGVLDEARSTLETSTDVIVHTTMAPDEIQAVAKRMAESGFAIIDAPVTGGKAGADAGTYGGRDEARGEAEWIANPKCNAPSRERFIMLNQFRIVSEIL